MLPSRHSYRLALSCSESFLVLSFVFLTRLPEGPLPGSGKQFIFGAPGMISSYGKTMTLGEQWGSQKNSEPRQPSQRI